MVLVGLYCKKNGHSVTQVCAELNEFLQGQTAYSDGWVVDQPWLITLFYSANIKIVFSISPLEMLLSEMQMSLWHHTKDSLLAKATQPRHRASHDAALIQNTFITTNRLAHQKSKSSVIRC
jgi:hypothetical protein